MRRIFGIALLIFAALVASCGGDKSGKPRGGDGLRLQQTQTFEGGARFAVGKLNVLDISGTYREMGRQYGKLMHDEILRMYELAVDKHMIGEKGWKFEDLKRVAWGIFELYPQRFREIAYGIAETGPLNIGQLAILDQYLYLSEVMGKCSAISAWGNYTGNGPLIFGRNFDFPAYYKEFDEALAVIVYRPTDGSIPTAVITYAGMVTAVNAFNEKGLLVEINQGLYTGDGAGADDIIPPDIAAFQFMLDSPGMIALDAAIMTKRFSIPLMFNVADKNVAISYECTTRVCRKMSDVYGGLLVATNHYIDPAWGFPEPSPEQDRVRSVLRRENLVELAGLYKGRLDAKKMMAILDTHIANGGATSDGTIYQFVSVPAEGILWLAAPGFEGWTSVNLKALFENERK